MINNLDIIKPLLNFTDEGDFYMLYILKRKKINQKRIEITISHPEPLKHIALIAWIILKVNMKRLSSYQNSSKQEPTFTFRNRTIKMWPWI